MIDTESILSRTDSELLDALTSEQRERLVKLCTASAVSDLREIVDEGIDDFADIARGKPMLATRAGGRLLRTIETIVKRFLDEYVQAMCRGEIRRTRVVEEEDGERWDGLS